MISRSLYMVFFPCLMASCGGGQGGGRSSGGQDIPNLGGDSCQTVERRFNNGSVEARGQLCRGERNGHWEEFYSDGTLKWEGDYKMGYRELPEIDSVQLNCSVTFGDTLGFMVNRPRQCRIKVSPLNPKDLIIYVNQGSFDTTLASDLYDFALLPATSSDLCIEVLYRHLPNYSICKHCYPVKPPRSR